MEVKPLGGFFRGGRFRSKSSRLRACGISPENEISRPNQTKRRPQIVRSQRMFHVQERENRENDHGGYLLDHLELAQAEIVRADPVGGNLERVFEKGDSPADHYDNEQRITVHVL